MTDYGSASASSPNLRFAYDAALAAARELWSLAEDFAQANATMTAAHADAVVDFLGPMRTVFDDRGSYDRAAGTNAAGNLRALAQGIASDWAQARGQQDRINKARWVEHQRADDNFLEKGWQWFAGETDYGPPPANPATPAAPAFAPTREPQYPEFGP